MDTERTREELPAAGTAVPPLPAGIRLLHMGPHETGTTAVRGALFAAKEKTARHGVDFPAHSAPRPGPSSPPAPGPR
ncbi:hypothetical protein ACWZEH_10750 [Streptomyces sp. QTS137]